MWTLRNTLTGDTCGDNRRSFAELCKSIESEIVPYAADIFHRGTKKTIKMLMNQLKEQNEILVFENVYADYPQGKPGSSVWDFIKPKLIMEYLRYKFGFMAYFAFSRLLGRFDAALKDQYIVHISDKVDISQLGLLYTSARVYDSTIPADIIIVTQEQLNYMKLAYPENTILETVDVNKLLTELKKIGLYDKHN